MNTLDVLVHDCQAAQQKINDGRHELIRAIRTAAASGLTQRDIAQATGYSQPEINRLIRFCGTSPNGKKTPQT